MRKGENVSSGASKRLVGFRAISEDCSSVFFPCSLPLPRKDGPEREEKNREPTIMILLHRCVCVCVYAYIHIVSLGLW